MRPDRPSPNLSWAELACKDGTPYPDDFIEDGRVYKLAHVFENIRKMMGGKPLIIHSAYRTIAHNKSVGGASSSQHLQGRALDIAPLNKRAHVLFNTIQRNSTALGVRGIGLYITFVHVDIRLTDALVVWSGYDDPNKTSRGQ